MQLAVLSVKSILSLSTLMIYGALAMPLAVLSLPAYVFLPTVYAKDMGLGLAAVGTILLLARLVDVLSDPIVGWISDRLPVTGVWGRFGRRKPLILIGLPLVVISIWFLFRPSPDLVGQAAQMHLLVWSILLYVGWTLMILPHSAMGADLSADFHDRTRIAAFREGFVLLGTIIALGIAGYYAMKPNDAAMADGVSSGQQTLQTLAVLVVVTLPILGLIFALKRFPDWLDDRESKDEKKDQPQSTQDKPSLWMICKSIYQTPYLKRLLLSYLLNGLANGLPATLFLLFVEYGLGVPEKSGLLLFVYFLSALPGIPLWFYISRKLNKHHAWCLAMLFASLVFLITPFTQSGEIGLFLLVCIGTGLAVGADLTLPSSMQADIADAGMAKSGLRLTGIYFGLWSMVTKLALALAVGIAFPLLGMMGFTAEGGGRREVILLLYAIVPVFLKGFSILLMVNFPLKAGDLDQLQKQIKSTP